jgi:hypothetical protein
MSEGRRRRYGVLSLLLVVALLGSLFAGDASAKRYSKAQKAAIGKKLMHAVKKSKGRVLTKKWFLKKASQVDWTLPLTVRLLPATDQHGGRQHNAQTNVAGPAGYTSGTTLTVNSTAGFKTGQSIFVFAPGSSEDSATVTDIPDDTTLTLNAGLSNPHGAGDVVSSIPGGANQASLDLGPSLGVRSIGLGGFVPARVNFSDAFSGGQLGDVKLTIPPNSQVPGGVTTTSVPLLANTNASTLDAPNNSINYMVLPTTANPVPALAGAAAAGPAVPVSLGFDGCDGGGAGAGFNTGASVANNITSINTDAGYPATGSSNLVTLTSAIASLNNPKTNCSGANAEKVGDGVYTYAAPYMTASGPLAATCPVQASFPCTFVEIVFAGPKFNGTPMPPLELCTVGNGCAITNSTGNAPAGAVIHGPPSIYAVAGNPPEIDNTGQGGCGNFPGNGTGNDVDLLEHNSESMNPPGPWPGGGHEYPNQGPGPSYGGSTNVEDVVLRTGPLTATVADPGEVQLPGDHQGALGIFSANTYNTETTGSGIADYTIGPSGGKANLFGTAVNGLSSGNSIDVTVNLGVDVMTIAREVDGGFPGPSGSPDETYGNINAYANCRQAWSGVTHDYLTNVHLVGALKISPAITADGKLRIAKTYLHSPYPSRQSLAACLMPHQLYMQGNPFVTDPPFAAGYPGLTPAVGPNLVGGAFNPLVELTGSVLGSPLNSYLGEAIPSRAPTANCNASGGPLDRAPFNVSPFPGGTSLSNILTKGAAVAVSANLSVSNLEAEALVGDVGG